MTGASAVVLCPEIGNFPSQLDGAEIGNFPSQLGGVSFLLKSHSRSGALFVLGGVHRAPSNFSGCVLCRTAVTARGAALGAAPCCAVSLCHHAPYRYYFITFIILLLANQICPNVIHSITLALLLSRKPLIYYRICIDSPLVSPTWAPSWGHDRTPGAVSAPKQPGLTPNL